MSNSTLESQVKKQAALLANEVENILSKSSIMLGQFVAFFNGVIVTGNSHAECFKKAEEKFGDNGFAISEITAQKPVLSSLIKLK